MITNIHALDYPHFTINNIGCDSCHFVYGSQPSLLPPWTVHTPQDIDDTQFNTLCWSCHNDIDAPYVRTHSSLQTDNGYGDWTVECRVCHNPHYQKQSRTYGSPSYLYSGNSTGVTTTTITKAGETWVTNAYVGYVVYPNVSQKNYNYKILSNTSDTLTVQGPMNLTKVAVGNTFAIVYGKLISDAVDLSKITITPAKSGTKTTRFFNTTGTNSFADGDTTYDGVCEVCHTQTTHFKNDGTGSDQLHTNMGVVVGTRCVNCHSHVNGFRGMGGGAHTTHVQKGYGPQLACAECHGTNVPPMLADGQNLANTTVCDACHSVSGAAIAKQYWGNAGSSEGTVGSWAAVESETSFCGSCHDATPGNTKGDGSGDTAPNVMGDNSTYGYSVTGHGKTTGNYPKLSWQASSATGNPAANRQCSACHNLTSTHFNTANKRLKSGYENDANNSNCIQCHDTARIAIADPQWYTNYNDYQNSAHNATKCSACHDVHGASGNNPGMTKANQEGLCYQCHTEGVVQNVAISGALVADDIQQAFNLTSKHNLGTAFTISANNYTLECVSCHNVHIVTGKYWEADQGKSPVTRFTNNTAVWGVSLGQKMDDYAAAGSTPGIYVTLPSDTFSGSQLPDYPTFCLDCHGTGGSNLNNLEPSPYFRLNWDDDGHGRQAAGKPAGGGTYPDWDGVGYTGGESNGPAWKIPKSRGFEVMTYQPYDMGKRIGGDNFVLSCTNCHEAHGSNIAKMQRSIQTQEASGVPNVCSVCHYTYSPWHEGMGCGYSSCHLSPDIHRLQQRGGPGTYSFDNTRPAYIKFDGEQYDVTDSGSWKNHGRWLKNNAPVDSGTFAAGVYNQAGMFDGSSDAVELGTRKYNVTWHGTEDSNSNYRNTYLYFEMKNNVTLEAWIKPAQLGGKRVIMSNEIADANYSFSIRDNIPGMTGPRLVFQLYLQDSPDQWRGAFSSVDINPNIWTYVAATYDAFAIDGKKIKIYKSGQDVTANTGTGEFAQPNNDAEIFEGSTDGLKQRFVIGANPNGVSDFFNGLIDEAYVYNITRTPAQVLADAASPVGAVTMTAVASDVSLGGRGVQTGDKVVITFSAATNGPLITNGNINAVLALSGGHSWLDGSGNIDSAQWSTTTNTNDTLTITLSDTNGPPSVTEGDTITVSNGVVTDIYDAPLNTSSAITGTFGIGNSQGMVGYWMLDEGSGATATDSSGEDNDGAIIGASWTGGKVNSALSFDGIDDYVSVLNDASLNVSDISLEAWINSGSYTGSNMLGTANYMVFSRQSAGSAVNGYELGINDEGKPYFTFEAAGVNTWNKLDNTIPAAMDAPNGRIPLGTLGKGDQGGASRAAVIYDNGVYKAWYSGRIGSYWNGIYYATSFDGLHWTKYDNNIPDPSDGTSTNGRIPVGTTDKGDSYQVYAPTVIKDGSTYKMWYTGIGSGGSRIYYATSPDGLTWTKYDNSIPGNSDAGSTNGRLPKGNSPNGDNNGVLEPAVIKDGATYKMWYAGNNGAGDNRIYYATSPDGLTWTKYDNSLPSNSDSTGTNGRIPWGASGGDIYDISTPTVINDGSTYKMWYSGSSGGWGSESYRIYYATSPDGLTWTKYNNSVPAVSDTTGTNGRVPQGNSGKGDSDSVLSPALIKDGEVYKMWYLGFKGGNSRTFYATSPNGVTWTKYDNAAPPASDTSLSLTLTSTNGRLPMGTSGHGDSGRLGKAAIIKDGSIYKMWYQGLPDSGGSDTRIYYATSVDGLSWTKYDNTIPTDSDGAGTNGRIPLGTSGKGDEYSIGAATVLKEDTTYKMWYTGSNDGNSYRIYYATSSDGLTWTKYDNSIPSNSDTTGTNGRIPPGTSGKGDSAQVANPTVIKDGSTYKMWYTGKSASSGFTNRIYYATSPDGLTWTKYDNNIPADSDSASTNGRIPLGTSGKGDDGFAYNPTVIKDGSTYKMWYNGYKQTNAMYSFFATSPDGLTWTKYDNSVPASSNTTGTNGRIPRGLSGRGDFNYIVTPSVIKDGATYKMWYVGDDGTGNAPRRIFYATQDTGLTGNALTPGWHHVIGTKADDGTLKLYIDGSETASGATSVTGISNNSDLLIGSLFSGRLDELVLYNRVLTPGQVTDRYNSGVDYSVPPDAPTIGTPNVLSASSIRWNFTDNSTNEQGFKIHDPGHATRAFEDISDIDHLDETGLTADKQYTRHVHAYNPAGDSGPSADASIYTLPLAPNITANKTTSTWYSSAAVEFTNANNFGEGGVEYYRYTWDQNPNYIFHDAETQWTTGQLTTISLTGGSWYLHVKSYNGDGIANGTNDYGLFNYDATNPSSSNLSPADGAINIALNSNLTFTLSDAGSGIDWSTFSIQLTGSNGYSQSYNSASPEVTKTGDAASYNVTVDPAVSFSNNEVITVDVNASDSTGNPLSPPVWSFTTLDLPSGAVSYWKLDEGSGQSASDSVGTNNGTLGTTSGADGYDPVWTTPGKVGNALSFDGVDDRVNLGNPAGLNITGEITLSGWIRTSSTKGQMLIIAKHNGVSNGSYYLGTTGTANILRLMIVNSSSTRVNLDRAFTYNDGQWHYIAGTYDGANMKLYADGNLLGAPLAQTGSIKTTTYDVRIGSYTQDNNWVFSGLIDEVIIYNRALTPAEVLERYNAGGP